MMVNRQNFLVRVREKLNEIRVKLDQLRVQAIHAREEVRMHQHAHVAELQSRLAALQGGVVELERASGESWQKLSNSVERASHELDLSINQGLALYERTQGRL